MHGVQNSSSVGEVFCGEGKGQPRELIGDGARVFKQQGRSTGGKFFADGNPSNRRSALPTFLTRQLSSNSRVTCCNVDDQFHHMERKAEQRLDVIRQMFHKQKYV